MIVMGRIVAPYGVYGWLKIHPETETLDSLFDYPEWWIGRDDQIKKSAWQKYSVETVKVHNDMLLVKLNDISDRDTAQSLKSLHVAIPRELFPEPGKDEYYWSDLVGLKVINLQHLNFGLITEVFETGANDVLVVKQSLDGQGERERLIPYIDPVIVKVDLQEKTMLVDWDAEF